MANGETHPISLDSANWGWLISTDLLILPAPSAEGQRNPGDRVVRRWVGYRADLVSNTLMQGGGRVETILVAGVESVVGANLAAVLSERYRVVGLASSVTVSIKGCELSVCHGHDADSVRHAVASIRPDWIIDCAVPADSGWQDDCVQLSPAQSLSAAGNWALAARDTGCPLTTISSDAVLTGPWMFHDENSTCFCQSEQARTIRTTEKQVRQLCPGALVVRTNAYGWSPASGNTGWIERTLLALETGDAGPYDCYRHATPILAGDLAEILERAVQARLSGLYHVAGAERTNPASFVQRLAEQFGLPCPRSSTPGTLSERPTGFGCGETSLQTRRVRKALGIAMPTLAEGLARLQQQHASGYRDLFESSAPTVRDKVA